MCELILVRLKPQHYTGKTNSTCLFIAAFFGVPRHTLSSKIVLLAGDDGGVKVFDVTHIFPVDVLVKSSS